VTNGTSLKHFHTIRKKTAGSHVALRRNFSDPVSATDPVKS